VRLIPAASFDHDYIQTARQLICHARATPDDTTIYFPTPSCSRVKADHRAVRAAKCVFSKGNRWSPASGLKTLNGLHNKRLIILCQAVVKWQAQTSGSLTDSVTGQSPDLPPNLSPCPDMCMGR
jgi:hypothetical protein